MFSKIFSRITSKSILMLIPGLFTASTVFSANKELCPQIDRDLSSTLVALADNLIKATSEKDTLLLVGQSPAYLKPLLEKGNRKTIQIAVSRSKPAKTLNPNEEQLKFYCDYLAKMGVNENLLQNENLILIDHSFSGKSLGRFAEVLNKCIKKDMVYRFINFASAKHIGQHRIHNPDAKVVNTISIFGVPHRQMMTFADDLPRTIPEYPVELWKSMPDPGVMSEGKACYQKMFRLASTTNF